VSKRKVLYRKAAQQDLTEAFNWYDSIDPGLIEPGLAERLLEDLRLTADRVAAHPLSCPTYLGTTRRTRLKVFPYYLYYRLERSAVVVHTLLHTRRNPALHRGRAK